MFLALVSYVSSKCVNLVSWSASLVAHHESFVIHRPQVVVLSAVWVMATFDILESHNTDTLLENSARRWSWPLCGLITSQIGLLHLREAFWSMRLHDCIKNVVQSYRRYRRHNTNRFSGYKPNAWNFLTMSALQTFYSLHSLCAQTKEIWKLSSTRLAELNMRGSQDTVSFCTNSSTAVKFSAPLLL